MYAASLPKNRGLHRYRGRDALRLELDQALSRIRELESELEIECAVASKRLRELLDERAETKRLREEMAVSLKVDHINYVIKSGT